MWRGDHFSLWYLFSLSWPKHWSFTDSLFWFHPWQYFMHICFNFSEVSEEPAHTIIWLLDNFSLGICYICIANGSEQIWGKYPPSLLLMNCVVKSGLLFYGTSAMKGHLHRMEGKEKAKASTSRELIPTCEVHLPARLPHLSSPTWITDPR